MGRAWQAHQSDLRTKKGGKHENQHESVWEKYVPLAQKPCQNRGLSPKSKGISRI